MTDLIASLPAGLPALYQQDGAGGDAIAHIKLFTPDAGWTWYLTEYNPDEHLAFGLVVGLETELGYFSLTEIAAIRGHLGLPVERDLHFDPTPLRDLDDAPAWLRQPAEEA